MFHSSMKTIKPPLKVKATASQVQELSVYLNKKNLTKILLYFSKYMRYDGPFVATNISTMISLAKILDTKSSLSLDDKYMLASAPINTRSPLIKNAYLKYVNNILNHKTTPYKSMFRGKVKTYDDLLKLEDEIKKISLYLWLCYKLPDIFIDKDKALKTQIELNKLCQTSLKSIKFKVFYNNRDRNYNRKKDYTPRSRSNRGNRW